MYCVIRFANSQPNVDLRSIGESLNACQPGSYEGPDWRMPNRFSCSLADGDDWESQRQGIFDFMRNCAEVIRNAQTLGIEITLDLAIYQRDYQDQNVIGFLVDRELIELLSEHDLDFAISVYGLKDMDLDSPSE